MVPFRPLCRIQTELRFESVERRLSKSASTPKIQSTLDKEDRFEAVPKARCPTVLYYLQRDAREQARHQGYGSNTRIPRVASVWLCKIEDGNHIYIPYVASTLELETNKNTSSTLYPYHHATRISTQYFSHPMGPTSFEREGRQKNVINSSIFVSSTAT